MNFPVIVGRWKPVFICLLVGLSVTNLGVLWYGHDYMVRGYGDFAAFYTAGKILQRGQGSRLYDERQQWDVQLEFASTVTIRRGPLPFIRPPFQAILFFPMAWLEYSHAFFLWTGLKILILFLIPYLLKPHLPRVPPWFYGIASLLSLSVAWVTMDLLQGQDAILFLLVCVLSFSAASRRADFLAGIWLGLGLFKFHIVLPIILVLALRRKGRTVLGFLLVALCLLLISIALVGWETLLYYPQYLWRVTQHPGLGVMQAYSMPTLRGFLHGLARAPAWHRLADWLYIPLALLGIVTAAAIWPSRDDSTRNQDLFVAGYSFCLVTAILVSFYFSGYDMMLLLLPALLLTSPVLSSPRLAEWAKVTFVVTLGFLLFLPISWILLLNLHPEHWETLALLLLAGVLAYAMNIWQKEASVTEHGSKLVS